MVRPSRLTLVLTVLLACMAAFPASVGGPTVSYKFTVVIDPGHGGKDPGATAADGATEKEITREIAELVFLRLLDYPELRVVLSRQGDEYIYPSDRVLEANRLGADVYVSIHCNAHSSSSISGVETFVDEGDGPSSSSWRLARLLQSSLLAETRAEDRGVKQAPLYIRHATMAAALIEVGFLTHRYESKLLESLSYQSRVADGIQKAVTGFLRGK
ncbi:MAG: N-acetylmuramoyl-L-alanine amidase [Candidatus Bipolaricaulota bacterium]|nr:N-acetylmuramoyl-L-alanine amidase [Candidatus Bipolaricaulota bacterium]